MAGLEARVLTSEQAKRRLVREIGALPDYDEMAKALRGDLWEQYREREGERRALVEELAALKSEAPHEPEDPTLLEELPSIPVTLDGVPEDRQRGPAGVATLPSLALLPRPPPPWGRTEGPRAPRSERSDA